MLKRELLEGNQSQEAEQVEPTRTNSPHGTQAMSDILRQPLAFSGVSSQDISGPADPGAVPREWNEKSNRQIDQQASTSGSALEYGEPDQVKGKRKRATEGSAAWKSLPKEMQSAVIQKLDLPSLLMAYRSFDDGYKILSHLDNKRRQEVIDHHLKDSDQAEHFDALETPDERKEFLDWIGIDGWETLFDSFSEGSQKLKKLLGELDSEQIEQLVTRMKSHHEEDEQSDRDIEEDEQSNNNIEKQEYERKKLCEALPLEKLKILIDKSVVEYPEYDAREHAEHFNALKAYNDKKGFIRDFNNLQAADLYTYFKEGSQERIELCRAMARENLEWMVSTYSCGGLECDTRKYAEEFSALEKPSDRANFLGGFHIERITHLYRYFDHDPDKQNLLCRSLTLENLESLSKKLTFDESAVARSLLKEWK